MKNRNETDTLNEMILVEEMKYANDLALLKNQFQIAYESVKPINLIKNLVHDITSSPEIKNDLASNVIGLATGFLSKKMVIGSTANSGIFKKLFGAVIQFTIGNTVAKHTDDIKALGLGLLSSFLKRR